MKRSLLRWMMRHPWTHPASLYEALQVRWFPDWRAQLQPQGPWIRITGQQYQQCVASGIPVSQGLPVQALPQGREAGFYGRERNLTREALAA